MSAEPTIKEARELWKPVLMLPEIVKRVEAESLSLEGIILGFFSPSTLTLLFSWSKVTFSPCQVL